ncbi:MAG: cell wall-active antibiotics response protein LiaF, partial [Bacteroidota bacterium]
STVFGDSKIFVESKAFKGGTISTVFGDCILDCSRTGFSDGEQTIRVSGVFGDLSVLLPPGIAYTLGAHTLFGAIDAGQEHRDGFASTVRYRNPGYDAAQKKVRLELSGVFGDIMVHA